MEEELLVSVNKESEICKWDRFFQEMKRMSYIAMPMVLVTVSQNLLRVISMMMVGHLGELSLSGAAVATSLTNVTGFSLMFGLASALETLCGQAYGAEQFKKLGVYTYGAIISLLVLCIPVSFLWLYMDEFLVLIGQDPLISLEAGKYAMWLIPTLFPYAILQLLVRYLQSQSLILPMVLSSIAALILHMPLCWAFVFKFDLGSRGAALSLGFSHWLNVILLGIYVKCSSSCEKTRVSFSNDVFLTIGEFFRFAIPSAIMVCLEWWSFELIILLAGKLANPQLETSVLSVCFTVTALHYYIPYSFGAAASTRVSNALGAGNPNAAQLATMTVMVLGAAEVIIAVSVLYCCRNVLGYAFGYEKEVVDYVTDMTPIICLSMIMDSLQAVVSGIARGTGWQHIGAYVNLGAYYLVGIPVALVSGFVLHFGGKGLWLGFLGGALVQCLMLSVIASCTDWRKQARKARERIFEDELKYGLVQ